MQLYWQIFFQHQNAHANSQQIEQIESIETARQVNTTVTEVNTTETEDPDRYKHCDYLDLVEVGYREDSICKPGDKMVFKVNYLVAVKRL